MPTPPKKFDDIGAGFEDEMSWPETDPWAAGPDLPDDEPMPEELDGGNDMEACEECGAPEDMPCDPQCPNADQQTGVDPDSDWDSRGDFTEAHDKADTTEPGPGNHASDCECKSCELQTESFGFGKFMNRIISEETKTGLPVLNDSPHRKRALREQERPMGRTRIGGK